MMMRKLSVWGVFLGVILFAAGCAQLETASPEVEISPAAVQETPPPTLMSVTPQGEPVTAGFNIRGWT